MDKGRSCTALLTDLSRAFECIVHDFLIAKLEAYGFFDEAFEVIHCYYYSLRCRSKQKDFNWFSMNYLKANPGKSQLLLTSKEKVSNTREDTTVTNSSSKKQLVVSIDNKLALIDHVSKLYEK